MQRAETEPAPPASKCKLLSWLEIAELRHATIKSSKICAEAKEFGAPPDRPSRQL
jgi:hypothetical protein